MQLGTRTVVEPGSASSPVEGGRVERASGSRATRSLTRRTTAVPTRRSTSTARRTTRGGARSSGREPEPGTFGENLTAVELRRRATCGSATASGPARRSLEVTAPRIPCSVFRDPDGRGAEWVKRFAAARRPGLYVRVLEPGDVAAGDPVGAAQRRVSGQPTVRRPDGRLVRRRARAGAARAAPALAARRAGARQRRAQARPRPGDVAQLCPICCR